MASALQMLEGIRAGDPKVLARALTLVENELDCWQDILLGLKPNSCKTIGITGPPGAGKSTLVNALIKKLLAEGQRIAVIAIDPTSPFNMGSLLGDRIRMSSHFTNTNVFIRSLATRGSLGGLSAKAIEITDILKTAPFDYIFIETVGVGQSEIEIAGLADLTVVVLVPESGDEVQFIKSGLMEVANVFVVNKADREGADAFTNKLLKLSNHKPEIKVFKTDAERGEGVSELAEYLVAPSNYNNNLKIFMLAEKAYRLISEKRMKDIRKADLIQQLMAESTKANFNLYAFVSTMI